MMQSGWCERRGQRKDDGKLFRAALSQMPGQWNPQQGVTFRGQMAQL